MNNPPFSKGSWQHAVDDQLVVYGKTSQEFANPHEAIAWLLEINGKAALAVLSEPAAEVQPVDVEAMLVACVPGGSICDPQQVADAIRSYFAAATQGQAQAAPPPDNL